MNTASLTIAIFLLIVGLLVARFSFRRHEQASDLLIEDIARISREKPDADLDSDPEFRDHKDSAGIWLIVLFVGYTIIFAGLIVMAMSSF